MAGSNFDIGQALNMAGQVGGGALKIGSALESSYFSTPKASSSRPYKKKASMVGNTRYGISDMSGVISQIENTPFLQDITGKDLYNPSSEEIFSSFLGAGMSSYGAAASLTSPFKQSNAFVATPAPQVTGAPTYQGGQAMDMDEWSELMRSGGQEGVINPVTVDTSNLRLKSCGGRLHKCGGHLHKCGGHMFDFGGFNWGNAGLEALNLVTGGLGIALNYAGQRKQMAQAAQDAAEVNAINAYARQLNQHNQEQLVTDSKNNMARIQALQTMAFGGDLETHGAEFPMLGGFNIIGAGGTHEQNPFGGVYQGTAADGLPNLVEEDEVVWNNYVFSNRIKVNDKFAETYKLPKDITYAEAATKLSKEAVERPNDPISQNGLAEALGALMSSQEETKMKRDVSRVKRQLSKMTPNELMDVLAAVGGAQTQQPTAMPMMQGAQIPFAYGGFLGDDAHYFARGGSKEDTRYERLLNQLSERELRMLASKMEGYNPDDYRDTNAKSNLLKFLQGKKSSKYGYDQLKADIDRATTLRVLQDNELPAFTYTNTPYTMGTSNWSDLFAAMDAYQESLKEGKAQDKYHADPNFNTNGKSVTEVENDPDYKAFKKYVKEQVQKYTNGEDADENVLKYIQALDKGINTSKGARRLLQYNEDGTVKTIDGRVQFDDNWEADYDKRNFDKIGGIYHLYTGVPSASTKRIGTRDIYQIQDAEGNWVNVAMTPEELAENGFLSEVGREAVTDGDDTTNYIKLAKRQFKDGEEGEGEYTDNGLDFLPKQTISRYAPVVGSALGALATLGQQRDYSTGFIPRTATYAPIGDYLGYVPVDSQRYINAENQQMAAQLNAIMNASAGNKNMAMAQGALARQQGLQGLGQLLQTIEQINFGRKAQVGEFNRGTNMFNAQAFNQAELANLQNNPLMLRQAQQNEAMRYRVDSDKDAALSENLTALFDSLGNIGKENLAWNQVNSNKALRYRSTGNPFISGLSYYTGADGGFLLTLPKTNRRK